MRQIIIFLALCCLGQPAFAQVQADEFNRIFEKPNGEGELLPEYRKCSIDSDCTYIPTVCGDNLAVNKSSKRNINGIIQGHYATFNIVCRVIIPDVKPINPPKPPSPTVKCIKNLCESVPKDSK